VRILFLSQRIPYPPQRGDKITTWRLVERLSRRHEVRVVAFAHDAQDMEAARALDAKGIATLAVPLALGRAKARSIPLLLTKKPLTLGVYGSERMQREVDRLAPWAELAYAYSSSMGAFLLSHPELPRVMHFAELDSDKWRQYAARTTFPASWVYRRESRTLLAFERELAHAVDANVFCTPLEQQIFQREIPGAASCVIRNGVDLAHFRPVSGQAEPAHLVFVGVMDYYPNVDGCVWFAKEVFPKVRERFPGARFTIVGSHPTSEILGLASRAGIQATGFVEDTRTWLARAAVSVAPLRIARGIQNKVLEAMAMGLPVVGTTSATQGVEGESGRDFLLADGVEAQVEAVCALLSDPTRALELGARARRFVEERYDWEVALAPLDQLVDGLARPEQATQQSS
jgi:sugar transferase (PEP-CTERM/EpsH1 system associated)